MVAIPHIALAQRLFQKQTVAMPRLRVDQTTTASIATHSEVAFKTKRILFKHLETQTLKHERSRRRRDNPETLMKTLRPKNSSKQTGLA